MGLLVLQARGSGAVEVEGGVLRYDPEIPNSERARLVAEALASQRAPRPSVEAKRCCCHEQVLESLAVGVVVSNGRRVVWASDLACEMLGRTLDDLTSVSAADVVHPDDLAENLRASRDLREGGTAREVILRWRDADGEWRRVQWFAAPADKRGLVHSAIRLLAVEPAAAKTA